MSLRQSAHQLQSAEGLPIRITVREPEDGLARANLVVCHGFKGFAAWGFFPFVGERLAAAGFRSAIFDFSHNGIGELPEEFTRLDLFASNDYGKECDELGRVLDWMRAEFPAAVPDFGLLGHSRGALATIVTAAERADVGAVVTWNGVSRALRYTERQLAQWEQDGQLEFTNARTGQRMAISYEFVVDALEQRERFDLPAQAARMRAPHLIVHGGADMAVDPSEAAELRGAREVPRCELVRIEGATHTFGAVHPFAGTTPHLEQAIGISREWFDRWLGSE